MTGLLPTGEDLLDLRDMGCGFEDVQTRQDGTDVQPELANGTIVLENADLAELDSSDFRF